MNSKPLLILAIIVVVILACLFYGGIGYSAVKAVESIPDPSDNGCCVGIVLIILFVAVIGLFKK